MTKPFVDPKADLLFPQPRPEWVKEQVTLFNQKLETQRREEKFREMSLSSFVFFRGTDHLYWADFGESLLTRHFGGKKGTRTWLCGDMHCGNFGTFTDAKGRLVYDVNDFDESIVADYQLDLWRLVVSLNLLARENKLKPHHRKTLIKACAKGYFREIERCREDPHAAQIPMDHRAAKGRLKHFLEHVNAKHGRKAMLERWTMEVDKDLKFNISKNLDLEPVASEAQRALREALEGYAENLKPWPVKQIGFFEVKDLAIRLHQGVGSYGFKRFYALVEVEAGGKGNYRILDVKYQPKPSPWAYLPKKPKQKTKEACGGRHALRTVLAYQALGHDVDPWLGWLKLEEGEFAVRERSPYKAALPFEKVDAGVAFQMGQVLARAHCRTQKRFASKVWKRLKGKEKKFSNMLQVVAHAYADQVTMDYKSFREGFKVPERPQGT
jgi:uncharacterized protein (DUF2252 family)